jgi:hypothetical protein
MAKPFFFLSPHNALQDRSSNNTQCKIGNNIKQDDAYLVESDERVMSHIKPLHRQLEPFAMESIHKIMGKHKP